MQAAKTSSKATSKKAAVVALSPSKTTGLAASSNMMISSMSGSSSSTDKSKTVEEIYQKKSQLEHILLRPDTYIGSVETISTPMWVYENDKMVYRNTSYVPGLYKIFDEIIVNAADNKIRDSSMDSLKLSINKEDNQISIYNNGRGIPVQIHKEEGVYVPELIFGHLLTSSNYNDNEKKMTGGRNGYGAKLCNIFSTEFIVETACSASGKKYKQVFSNNMADKSKPILTENKKNENFTRITFKPDLAKFGMTHLDNDFEALVKKRAYDMAGCLPGVNVYLNDVKLKIKDFKQYVDLYLESTKPEGGEGATSRPAVVYERVNNRWEVAVTLSDGQFQQVSFVNSICTSKGGTHVTYVADQVVGSLLEAVKKKDKKGVPLKPFQAKNHLWVFVNCLVENPSFDSQTKENMTLRTSAFGSKCSLNEEFIKKVLKSGVVESVLSFAQFKQQQALKKSDGRKHTRITGIAKLDDANNAGSKNGQKCTLILTEGDSAKSLAVSGLGVVGRDNYGVFPLRGKLLNVREATHQQIMNNAEINAVKQILGLQHGKTYISTESLRYGHLMIMTDQDHDGSHIKGLIINFLDHFWPSLMKVPGFLLEFITPIVKVSKGKDSRKQEVSFFTIPEYESWKEANDEGKGWTIKYYKGLGTSTTDDAKKYFNNMDKHRKEFQIASEDERQLIDMAFNKKKADDRKEWLRQYVPGTFMNHNQSRIPISDFVNHELILFSMADNARSIPSVVDGLKPGQRKILFSCFKRNLKAEIKVAQLAGYVSEHSAYHHGEQSLCSTIVGLAQNFCGSNNLPLLEPLGQFGTRLQGGKDAASPRYIFTTLSPLARAVYHPNDDNLLKYLNDDGQNIEPEWYMPILPMILINGGDGIGTGWSTSIPNYNPRDIVENLFKIMDCQEPERMHPWYRGFKGVVEELDNERYKITGKIRKVDSTTVEITELPVRTWTQAYKEQLEQWLQGVPPKQPAWITDYKEYHTDSSVHFLVSMSEQEMAKAEEEGLEKRFKISTTISTSNLVCFDKEGRIKKYDNVNDILKDFFEERLKYYQARKAYLLDQLTTEWEKLDNKVRFILEIIKGTLVVSNRKKVDILKDLKDKKYRPIMKSKNAGGDEDAGDGGAEDVVISLSDHGYDYLLSMQLWSLTMEKVQQLVKEKEEKEKEVTLLTRQSPTDLWRTDLDSFLVKWETFEIMMDELESKRTSGGSKNVYKQLKSAASKKPAAKKTASKKKVYSDSEMSDEESSEDYDDDEMSGIENKVTKKPSVRPQGQTTIAKSAAALLLASTIDRTDREDSVKLSEITKAVSGIKLSAKSSDSTAPPKKRVIKKNAKAAPIVAPAAEALSSSFDFEDNATVAPPVVARPKAKAPSKPAKKTIISDDSEEESSESLSEISSSESDLSSDVVSEEEEDVAEPAKKASTITTTKKSSTSSSLSKIAAPSKTAAITKKSVSSSSSRETSPEVKVIAERKKTVASSKPPRATAPKKTIVISSDNSDEEEVSDASSFDMSENDGDAKPKRPVAKKLVVAAVKKPTAAPTSKIASKTSTATKTAPATTASKPSKQHKPIVIDSESEQSDDFMVTTTIAPVVKERAGRAAAAAPKKSIIISSDDEEEDDDEDEESEFNAYDS